MNDMILNLLANDSFTVSDFKAAGLTAENTKLESEDKYLQSEMIQNNTAFQDDNGNFDKDLFHQYYLQATEFYNRMADDTYIEDLSKTTFYSKDNLFAPDSSPTIDELPRFVVSPNPFLQSNSLTRVGKKGDRSLSISEIAQTQKVYDSKKGEFREESVNDRAAGNGVFKWLGDLFSEPLVIAQWDEDGEHVDPLTGVTKKHKKGDYKYNDDGTFYYETLNGRDVYGRQVLNRMNTLTVDGSKANRYDFFDSDDLEQKSFVGTTLKNLALVGSMFIPYVGPAVIASNVAAQSVGLLGTLGKMFLGSDNKTANNMHAWAKTVNRQTATEYASQNTWCWENMLNMIGDTVGQLAEQRFIFTHVPALLKGTKGITASKGEASYQALVKKQAEAIEKRTHKDLMKSIANIERKGSPDAMKEIAELRAQHQAAASLKAQAALEKYMESYHDLGSVISKAYMTGITVQDTYGEAKANGASDLEALALTLGYAAGEAWILNTGLGEWIIPEAQGEKLKYGAIAHALKKEVKDITGDAAEAATKEGRQNIFKKIFNIGSKIATDDYARQHYISKMYSPMQVVLAHAAGESFEEVSEEVLADISKSAFNAVAWLRGDDTRISGAWEDIGNRYAMSALGGFIGGGISSAATDFSQAKQLANMTNETAMQEIVYMINNNKIDDFLKYINGATLGNKYLSFDTDENGNFKQGSKENNQDSEIKKALNLQIKLIRDTIEAEGAKFSENSLFDAVTLKDLRYLQLRDTVTLGAMFQEYNSLVTDMVKISSEIRKLTGEDTNTDTKKKELTEAEAGRVAELKRQLNDLRVRKDAIISGKRAPEFIATALYEAQQALHGHKRGYVFQEWAEAQTKKKYEDLTEAEIKELKPKYKAYLETEMKNDVLGDAKQFVHMVGLASGAIKQQEEYVRKMLDEGRENALLVQSYLGNLFNGINAFAEAGEDFDVDDFIQKVQEALGGSNTRIAAGLVEPYFTREIRDRLAAIDAIPLDEDDPDIPEIHRYTQKKKDLDKLSTVFEAFAEYSDTITQAFIDKGYIHPEVKNAMVNTYQQMIRILAQMQSLEAKGEENGAWAMLGKLSPYFGMSDYDVIDFATDGVRSKMLTDYMANLEAKIEQLQGLSHTPVIELLERFKVATSDSDISVSDVIEKVNTILNEDINDISAFGYGEDVGKQLDEIEQLIDVLASAIYGTRVDEAGINNSWGYSKTLNELNKKYGNNEWVELAEIQGATADLIMQDLALVKQKIHLARNIRNINSGQKLTQQAKVGYNKQFIFANKLKRMLDQIPPELTDWNFDSIRSAFSGDLLLIRYNDPMHQERRFGLTQDEKVQIERESLMLDDAIYQFFQDNADKVSDVNQLAKLLNPVFFNLYDPATGLLHDETDDLDDNQFIFSLAAKAAVKGSDFFGAYRHTFNDDIAPVPMQEQATYLNVAMMMNGDVINNFARAYAISLANHFKNLSESEREARLKKLENSDGVISHYVKNPDAFAGHHAVEKFANIILTEGIAGSGKTGGVFSSTVRVLKQLKPELLDKAFVVNATLDNATKLMNDLGIRGTAFSSSHKETANDLVRYFYSDYTPNYDGRVSVVNGKVVTNFKLKEDLVDLPKVIFLDEASRYDYVQMKLLSEAAQHYGIVILAAGDFDQISAVSTITTPDKKTVHLSPNRLNFIRSPKLGLSFRTLNVQMSKNQREILAGLHDSTKDHFSIHYWENDSEIRGFKNYKSSEFDGIVASIEKIKKSLADGEKIGFLYANEESETYKKVKEKYGDLIEGKSIADAQGLEGNYYIIDINQRAEDPQEVRQQIYTGLTRAKKGGLIISDGKSGQLVYIDNIKDETSELETISPEAISKASKKRKEIFDVLFDGVEDSPIEYHEISRVQRETGTIPVESEPETPEIPPTASSTEPPAAPSGTYASKSEAEKIDLSAYTEGLEVYDKDGTLVGKVLSASVVEHVAPDGTKFYAPAVTVEEVDGTVVNYYVDGFGSFTLKDPATSAVVPKYKPGDVFYTSEGDPLKVIETIAGDPIQYKVEDKTGSISTMEESTLGAFSMIPPVIKLTGTNSDLGENEDPEVYKQRIAGSNQSRLRQPVSAEQIHHWAYSFNSYETGGVWVEVKEGDEIKLKLDPSRFKEGSHEKRVYDHRIDNVNGLISLGIFDGPSVTRGECVGMLSKIHSILMSVTDNAQVLRKLESDDVLHLAPNTLGSIEYGIKSTAGFPKESHDSKYDVFGKNPSEKVEFAQEGVEEGDALSRKTIVAVIRDNTGKKVLEVTVGVLNNPITIGQVTGPDGKYVYPEVAAILEELQPGMPGVEVFKILWKAYKACEGPGYKYTDLQTLFKAYFFTKNAYVPLKNSDGTPFNFASQKSSGPNVIMEKGSYQKDGTRQYHTQYKDLAEFTKDPRVVVSDVYIPQTDTFGGVKYPIHKGYAGVFVSYNKDYDKDSLASIYMKQHAPGYKGPVEVEFYYVIPPEASVAEYLRNYRNVYLNQTKGESLPTYFIGNKWTAYQLLKNMHQAGDLVDSNGKLKLKSSSLDTVDDSVIISYVEKLIKAETTNWESDARYQELLTAYKDAGYSESSAKKYALRNKIIEEQDKILNEVPNKDGLPVYKVLTNYLANAVYWDSRTKKPNASRLAQIEAHNKGTIKYKVKYPTGTASVGLFIKADVTEGSYTMPAITADGEIEERGFLINTKIDPPIFEIPAVNDALKILADWEFENASDTNSGKKEGAALRAATEIYVRDTRGTARPANNFEILKKNNKILFNSTGLFKDIKPKDANDPDLDQIHFAEEILSEFNSQPDNLGFATVDASGNVKLHAFKISDLPGIVARPEAESLGSLGGITIGVPLVFKTSDDTFTIKTAEREYIISLESDKIVFTPQALPESETVIKVEVTTSTDLDEESFNKAIKALIMSGDNTVISYLEGENCMSYAGLLANRDSIDKDPDLGFPAIAEDLAKTDADFKKLYDFIMNGTSESVNVSIGDSVIVRGTDSGSVISINGSEIVVRYDDVTSEIVDVTKVDVLKKNEPEIECVSPIIIPYGK